ncbi:hypothetical protein INT46_006282 [Mucor plumbeus]|uniref:Uncharacterized protein n=1 Tax=Mucor plumbeus TaxID=97098 RepID=A0A8H7REE2_9FUNG|nr:hypothetical protein INT46_006282 [Mucor plumbeus]
MEPWKWALIGIGIAIFFVINAGVIYCLYRNKNKAINVDKYHQEQPIENTIDEGIIANNSIKRKENQPDIDLYDQQQEYITAVQTALSPPRPLVVKDKILTTSNKIIHEQLNDNKGQDNQQELRVFSLSPLHVLSSEKPSERTNSVCSTSTTGRSMTPFQGHHINTPTINSIWRGPTPPWTQYPGRHDSINSS